MVDYNIRQDDVKTLRANLNLMNDRSYHAADECIVLKGKWMAGKIRVLV